MFNGQCSIFDSQLFNHRHLSMDSEILYQMTSEQNPEWSAATKLNQGTEAGSIIMRRL